MHSNVHAVDLGLGLTRALSVANGNSADAAFPSRIPTLTKPVGVGVFDVRRMGQEVPQFLKAIFFGRSASNQTFTARVIGWMPLSDKDGGDTLWIPQTLVEVLCTLGMQAAVLSGQTAVADLFVDTIGTPVTGNDGVDVNRISPADDTVAHMLVDLKGSNLYEFLFKQGTASQMNALHGVL